MRARYTIFPKAGYVLETFSGAVTFARYEDFIQQQHQDIRIAAHYQTVSDFTQATLRLSITDVEQIAHLVCYAPQARVGRRALVINGPRNFAFADVFRNRIEQLDIVSQCFSHRDAALRWITASSWSDTESSNESFGIFKSDSD